MRWGVRLCLLVASSMSWASAAQAQPVSFPHGTIDQTFTTTEPGAPTGGTYTGRYHAAGDPDADPPFMERMVFTPPPGMRYDTSVPKRCRASDLELSMNGPAACPKGSRLGGGETSGVFMAPVTHQEFTRFTFPMDVMNNTNEQILLIKTDAGSYSVVRGQIRSDGSMEFASPTCFPTPPTGCVDDHVLQTGATSFLPPYTSKKGSYATTPPTCPDTGYWTSTVDFWWKDGTFDHVVTRQPCNPQ